MGGSKGNWTIDREVAEFNFAEDYTAYLPYSTNEKAPKAMAFQATYDVAPLSQSKDLETFLPATVDCGTAKVTLLETDVVAYPGMFVNRFPQKQEQPQCYAVVLAHAKAKNDTREKIVVDFLGQALAMRYLEVIREEMGAAYSVQAQAGVGRAHLKEYRSTLQVVLPVKPDMCDDALKVVDDILNEVAQNGVEDKYLTKIKEYELKNVDEAERQNGSWLGWFRAYIEDGMDGYTNIRKTIQSVTGKDLARAAKSLLKSGNHITVVMTPED